MSRRTKIDANGDVVIVRLLEKEILDPRDDRNQTTEIGQDVFKQFDEKGKSLMLIDLSTVKCMNSAMLGNLMTANKKAKAKKGKVVIFGVDSDIMEVFIITRLDKMLGIAENEESAMQEVCS